MMQWFRFEATEYVVGKDEEIHLQISVAADAARGLDLQDLKDCFKVLERGKKHPKKVVVRVHDFSGSGEDRSKGKDPA